MRDREAIHDYWRNPEPKNAPAMYVDHLERTAHLVGLIEKIYPLSLYSPGILEVGCNVGRNLNGLWEAGYHSISGIDINRDAIELLMKTYEMNAILYTGPLEEKLRQLMGYSVVFSMCVLMHIHPESEGVVFTEIARLAQEHIITIEDEVSDTWRHCPRNYKEVFEPFGFEQVFEEAVPWGEKGYVARVMKRVTNES